MPLFTFIPRLGRCAVRLNRLLPIAVLAGSLLVPVLAGPLAAASPTDTAFSGSSGRLDVDYASYLSKHDIVYNRPNTNPAHGLTVGNGRTGAMAWQANGLTMQVSNVDSSQQTAFGAGLVNLATSPAMDSGYSTFQQRLSLYDGTLTTKYDNNRTVTVMGQPNSEVMGIHVDDTRTGVSSVTLELSLWDVANLGNFGDVPDINTWRTVSSYADSTGAGISRGQTDAQKFGYTLAATVEGASYTASVVNNSRVRLTITPTSSYTVWFTASTRLNAPGNNSVNQAKNALNSVKGTGYATTLNNYRNWWRGSTRRATTRSPRPRARSPRSSPPATAARSPTTGTGGIPSGASRSYSTAA